MKDIAITKLFQTRDKAITARNRDAFMSTQAGDLPNCSYEGYISAHKLKTEVLSIYEEKSQPLHRVVFTKETYFPQDKPAYSTFILYFLIDTKKGWKIYRLSY